jgi:hypothetical protein
MLRIIVTLHVFFHPKLMPPFISLVVTRVADPHHLNADPDQSFQFNADWDPDFYFNADPDPAPNQSDENLRPLVYRPSRAPL